MLRLEIPPFTSLHRRCPTLPPFILLSRACATRQGCGKSKLSVLYAATIEGDADTVADILAGTKLSPNWMVVDTKNTLLHLAAINNRHKVITTLIEAGANPNLRNIDGHTPLMCAAQRGAAHAAKALLRGEAKGSKRAQYNNTALHLAAKKGRADCVAVLVDGGCKMNVHGQNGYTPLLTAVQKGHAETVEVLLEKGANYKQTNAYGQDAISLARQSNEATLAVVQLFIEQQEAQKALSTSEPSEDWGQ